MQPSGSGGGFGLNVTPLARKILITLVVAYLLQLVLAHSFPVNQWLAMQPVRSGLWRPWQPFTFLLLNGPLPWPLLEWFFLASFLGSVEQMLGRKRFIRGWLVAHFSGVAGALTLDVLGLLQGTEPAMGLSTVWTALIVYFGLTIPNSEIRLMGIVPIRAGWMAWGMGLLALLYFVSNPSPRSALSLFAWIGAWAWIRGLRQVRDVLAARKAANDIQRDLVHLQVLKGGKDDDDDEYIH